MALAFSTSLYIIGFTEAFLEALNLENSLLMRRLVGSITCLGLTVLTFFSTSLALRVQYLVLAAIALSLISLFAGHSQGLPVSGVPLWFSEGAESFETVFAVFFPAVTGFTAGVAMSGDLKNPRLSIPRGTLWAIGVGLLVYLAIPIFLGLTVDTEALREDQMIWMKIAWIPELVVAGVFAATLSSALGSILGAPRYLQALAFDRVVPSFLGKGYGTLNEPRIGTVATFLIAEAGILVGELDLIARIITMFFLTSYGFACLACGMQTWSAIPSFRPDFRVPAWVSFLGALVCLSVMFKLDATAMAGATLVMVGIFLALKKREGQSSALDIWQGFWTAVVQKGLLYLNRRQVDGKNWKPNVIVFGGNPYKRRHMALMADWLFQERGLATYFSILKGDVISHSRAARQSEIHVRNALQEISPQMMSRVIVSDNLYGGILDVSQAYGFSGLVPNTIFLGWAEETEAPEAFTNLMRGLLSLDRNLLMLRHDDHKSFGKQRRVDIWWGGQERNVQLMLLLGFLLISSKEWQSAAVQVNVIVDQESQMEIAKANLLRIITEARLSAEPNIIIRDKPTPDLIRETSSKADLVLMGLREPKEGETAEYVSHVSALLTGLGSVLLVRASSQFDATRLLLDEE